MYFMVWFFLEEETNFILKVPIWLNWKLSFSHLNVVSSEMTIRYCYFSMWFLCILGTWDCICPSPVNEVITHFYWPCRSAEWHEQKTNTECMNTCIVVLFFFPRSSGWFYCLGFRLRLIKGISEMDLWAFSSCLGHLCSLNMLRCGAADR